MESKLLRLSEPALKIKHTVVIFNKFSGCVQVFFFSQIHNNLLEHLCQFVLTRICVCQEADNKKIKLTAYSRLHMWVPFASKINKEKINNSIPEFHIQYLWYKVEI